MITYDFAPLHTVAHEIAPNVERHYHEMTEGDDYGPPDIDWDAYIASSRHGLCRAVVVRDKGILVGYSVWSIGKNPRYKTKIQASSDGIFLEKPYRGTVSKELIKKTDEFLRAIGVTQIVYILSDDRVGKLLKGYKSNYKVWSKDYE